MKKNYIRNGLRHLLSWPKILFYPALHSHEIPELSKRAGRKVWQSYLENRVSKAKRMYWVYGPNKNEITIIALEPHPEDKKNGAYSKIELSKIP